MSRKSFRNAVSTTFSATSSVLGSVDNAAQYVENMLDEALEVQEATRGKRVAKAILDAERDLADDLVLLTPEQEAKIKQIREVEAKQAKRNAEAATSTPISK